MVVQVPTLVPDVPTSSDTARIVDAVQETSPGCGLVTLPILDSKVYDSMQLEILAWMFKKLPKCYVAVHVMPCIYAEFAAM